MRGYYIETPLPSMIKVIKKNKQIKKLEKWQNQKMTTLTFQFLQH